MTACFGQDDYVIKRFYDVILPSFSLKLCLECLQKKRGQEMLLAILFCDEFFQKKSFFVQAKLTLNQIYSYLISAYFALGQGCPTF